jgi:hypothetical protein
MTIFRTSTRHHWRKRAVNNLILYSQSSWPTSLEYSIRFTLNPLWKPLKWKLNIRTDAGYGADGKSAIFAENVRESFLGTESYRGSYFSTRTTTVWTIKQVYWLNSSYWPIPTYTPFLLVFPSKLFVLMPIFILSMKDCAVEIVLSQCDPYPAPTFILIWYKFNLNYILSERKVPQRLPLSPPT